MTVTLKHPYHAPTSRLVTYAVAAIALAGAAGASPTWAADPKSVVATVGDHKITAQELDQKVKPQIAEMRTSLAKRVDDVIADKTPELQRKTLDAMVDDYLLTEAAKKDNLTVDEYVKKQYGGKSGVTEADAKAWYAKNKSQNSPPFDQIKGQLIGLMNRQAMIERLRKEHPVKINLEVKRVALDSSGHPSLGPKDAPVTMVEFTDFQCPFCKSTQATVKQLREKYGDKIRFVHMDFPLSFHSHALDAAKAARCANDQGKFWEFHDSLFENQGKLSATDLKATAKTLGLNTKEFDSCFDKGTHLAAIKADSEAGSKLGVDGTPAFFIDGRQITGAQPLPQFVQVIDEELANGAGQKQASAR